MKLSDIKPDLRVRVRSWQDMENEFGLDEDNNINVRFKFTREMRPLCGLEGVITDVEIGRGFALKITFDGDFKPSPYWFYHGMLEQCDEPKSVFASVWDRIQEAIKRGVS